MSDEGSGFQGGSTLTIVFGALATLVWFAPLSGRVHTAKVERVAWVFDTVMVPVIDAVGKMPLISVLGVLAVWSAAHALGLRLRLPRRAERPPRTRSEPIRQAEPSAKPRQRIVSAASSTATAEPEIDDLADLRAEWERQGTPHGEHVDPIAIIRKPREKERDWSNDRSWFGGLPRLGGQDWPRGTDGAPLPFAAQIDLAEIAAANPDTPLPKEGSLAFFINEGAVLYVPPGDHPHTPAPEGLPPAYEETSYPLPSEASPVTQPLFPFWPVEAVRMQMPDNLPLIDEDGERYEAIEAAQLTAMEAIAPRSQYSFSASSREVEGLEGTGTLWWYCADLVSRQLRASLANIPRAIAEGEKMLAAAEAQQARLLAEAEVDETALARSRDRVERDRAAVQQIEARGRALVEFAEHVAAFAARRDPWAVMSDDEVAVLQEVMDTAHRDFEHLVSWHVCRYPADLRNAAIRRMITGDQRAAAAIPDGMLALINAQYRLPPSWQHQMFGIGGCRQEALYLHLCDHLLLQIVYDHMPEFRFGDMGLWQFWISPEALAARQWDKVELTFECS